MKTSFYFFAALLALFPLQQVRCQVSVEDTESQITVSVNGKLFTALQKGADANKPYLWPLTTASGKRVVRSFPMEKLPGEPTDHPHQRGIWMGSEHVSGNNIWEIDPADPEPHVGKIRFKKVLETHSGQTAGGFTISAQWSDQDDKPILDETLAVTVYAGAKDTRTMDVSMTLKALKLATFEDARDGIIGIRLAPAFDEKNGGTVVNADGFRGAGHVEGSHSNWIDWQTNLDGEQVGVAFMNHPSNLHTPPAWRMVGFGLAFSNPFAQRYYDKSRPDGSVGLQAGDEVKVRYRFFIHPAGTDVAAAYKEFADQ